ncbi:hypothetical protein AV530_020175 [Patagioenas fasciata monilis]|uniref:Uncharacterized protein n=1 Tax=Patagioenas fasciata monilis TaxID=372326 RepID=A0A1V4KZR1_PATFA|nr:hypothetical protein AV530_020175 [Patagioenas fasciata monilis]
MYVYVNFSKVFHQQTLLPGKSAAEERPCFTPLHLRDGLTAATFLEVYEGFVDVSCSSLWYKPVGKDAGTGRREQRRVLWGTRENGAGNTRRHGYDWNIRSCKPVGGGKPWPRIKT